MTPNPSPRSPALLYTSPLAAAAIVASLLLAAACAPTLRADRAPVAPADGAPADGAPADGAAVDWPEHLVARPVAGPDAACAELGLEGCMCAQGEGTAWRMCHAYDEETPVYALLEHGGAWYVLALGRSAHINLVGSGGGYAARLDAFRLHERRGEAALVGFDFHYEAVGSLCIDVDGVEVCGLADEFLCRGHVVAVIGGLADDARGGAPRLLAVEDQRWSCEPGQFDGMRAGSDGREFTPPIERTIHLSDGGDALLVDGERQALGEQPLLFPRRPEGVYDHVRAPVPQ